MISASATCSSTAARRSAPRSFGHTATRARTGRDRWRTVRATLTDWTHLERSQLAYERQPRNIRGPSLAVGAYGEGAGQYPRELEFVVRVWLEGSARFRGERESQRMT